MALDKKIITDPCPAVSLQPGLSNQALPPLPTFQESKIPASLASEATDLLDALNHLHARGTLKGYDDASPPDLVQFNIGTCSLQQLCSYIKQQPDLDAWFNDSLHYEYTQAPSKGNIFTIKMPGVVHEIVAEYISDAWKAARGHLVTDLLAAQENPAIIKEIHDISCIGSPTIPHGTTRKGNRSQADRTWSTSIKQTLCPVFILEVAYRQPLGSLYKKAQKWVQGTASVQWVLGVKVYPAAAPATPRAELRLWQARDGRNGRRHIEQVQHKTIIPEDRRWPHLNLKLGQFLARNSTLPDRIQRRVLPIPLSPLPEKIIVAAEVEAEEAEKEKARKRGGSAAPMKRKRQSSRYDLRREPKKSKR